MFLASKNEDLIYSTVEGQSLQFSIGDPSIIIDIIRKKIYNHPIRTMVQEYLSNAKDSCIEAGKESDAINVKLATHLKPEFCIRDYGVGLSDERVRDVFVRYGISTKRDTNKQLGCFGIGAKSGWAYTDSFIIESFYNGIHRQYIADIAENREGRLLLYKEIDTHELNGVSIKIPVEVKDITTFALSLIRATFLWSRKPVIESAGIEIQYPKLLYDLGNVKIYEKPYLITEILKPGIYFDAIGIPFEINSIDAYVAHPLKLCFDNLKKWALSESIMVVITADPLKMDISANREGFTNQKYATKKVEYAYNKICDHIEDIFKKTPRKNLIEIFKENKYLTLVNPNFFDNKPYILRSLSNKMVLFKLNEGSSDTEGYFLFVEDRKKFLRCICTRLNMGNNFKIFKTRSKGLILEKDITPCILPETQKALTLLKALERNERTVTSYIVFFQNNMSDENYREVSEIIGAVQYVEDYYTENLERYKAIKKQQQIDSKDKSEKKTKQDNFETYTVTKFRNPGSHYKMCSKTSERLLLTSILNTSYMVFYDTSCSTDIEFLFGFIPLDIKLVHVPRNELTFIKKIDHPKLKPLTEVHSHIKNDDIILTWLNDIYVIHKYKSTFKGLVKHKDRLNVNFFSSDDHVRLKVCLDKLEHRYPSPYIFDKYVKGYSKTSIYLQFINTYLLLKDFNFYDTQTNVLEHINLYLASIDAKKAAEIKDAT